MYQSKTPYFYGCNCQSILGHMIDLAGQRLIQSQRFLEHSLESAGILRSSNSKKVGDGTTKENSPAQEGASDISDEDTGADKIFFGGSILTMVADDDRVEALAVKNGKIIAVGDLDTVNKFQDDDTEMVDLNGNCLMPGFMDPHSHLVLQAIKFAAADLDPDPIGSIQSMDDIISTLEKYIEDNNIPEDTTVIGWGYDDTSPAGMGHPDREILDRVQGNHRIMVMHISGHICSCNSALLEKAKINENTPDPSGGVIQRYEGTNEPNGVLEEAAMLLLLVEECLPQPTEKQAIAMIQKGIEFYAEAGITTAQDGNSSPGSLAILQKMADNNQLPIDVVAYPGFVALTRDDEHPEVVKIKTDLETFENAGGSPIRFRRGGIKLALDGSIQGYTGFLSEPYFVQPGQTETRTQDKCSAEKMEKFFITGKNDLDNATDISSQESNGQVDEGYCGYSTMEQEDVENWLKFCVQRDIPVLAHTNGDAATDILINAADAVRPDGYPASLRTKIVHAQTIRDEQLDAANRHGMVPSFFPIHIVFWGERHKSIFLGEERAARISPAKSALDRNMKFTLHHDAPVAGISMLSVAAAAVNRMTSADNELGPEQKITAFQALRAITADSAWQYFEEDRKGTLEVNKFADLVILSDDPLEIDPLKMTEIKVLETVKEGKTIFRKLNPLLT